ncbi:hypothetical protein LR48_Vigan04g070500 [Vigna angularis]|uniref:Uncharacterized protein n=1 Tax=Phaseolus angularis TaxID=3914 RepID=A0A0L9UD96_PHAAN|nr:hypothetical protein LR48_Vigan04g070500 [Vigna angularis]
MKPAAETVESSKDEETNLMAESTICEREGNSLKLKQRLEKEHEGRDEHQPTKGQDADPLSAEMSTGATPYRPKTDFERYGRANANTANGNQNLGDERVATDDEVEEEDDGDDGSKEKEREQEETDFCLMNLNAPKIGSSNLDALLGPQRSVLNKEGIGNLEEESKYEGVKTQGASRTAEKVKKNIVLKNSVRLGRPSGGLERQKLSFDARAPHLGRLSTNDMGRTLFLLCLRSI